APRRHRRGRHHLRHRLSLGQLHQPRHTRRRQPRRFTLPPRSPAIPHRTHPRPRRRPRQNRLSQPPHHRRHARCLRRRGRHLLGLHGRPHHRRPSPPQQLRHDRRAIAHHPRSRHRHQHHPHPSPEHLTHRRSLPQRFPDHHQQLHRRA